VNTFSRKPVKALYCNKYQTKWIITRNTLNAENNLKYVYDQKEKFKIHTKWHDIRYDIQTIYTACESLHGNYLSVIIKLFFLLKLNCWAKILKETRFNASN